MVFIFAGIIFFFGVALGSFIAVIADRYNTGLSFLKGRSVCFSCNAELKGKDLIPIFSFLFLRGRCRYCRSKIPKLAIFTEILMGVLSVLAAFKSGFPSSDFSLLLTTNYLLLISIFAVILLISIYDLKHFIIPDSFLFFLFLFSLFYTLLLATGYWLLASNIASGVILALPFLLIFLISKGAWFGFGDVKYILVLGFLLGFNQGLSAIVLAFWIGAAFSLLALLFKKIAGHTNLLRLRNNLTIKSEIPFGPFLSLGIITSFYFNADLFQIHELFNFL